MLIFSVFTGLSRVAGLGREILASALFATSGSFSAFTIAFQVPNLVRALFADAALSSAFVPVFADLLEHKKRGEAARLASTLLFTILLALGAITILFVLVAGVVVPMFIGPRFSHAEELLTVGLSRVLFPIVFLLGINGLLLGVLQTYEHFSIPAFSPVVWNVVIIVALVVLTPRFHGGDRLYAYAVGVLAGTLVQLAMAVAALRRISFRFALAFDWDKRLRQVLKLMLPVTVGLGIINFDLLINSSLGTLVSAHAPRAINAAFLIYMLPQGMFSVATATVLFPTLSRLAARGDALRLRELVGSGVRQINLLLIPSAVFLLVLTTPVVRLVFQHGKFGSTSTHEVSTALFWFAFSLPFNGVNLLLTRSFFSLQRPWLPTKLATVNLLVDVIVSLALYRPLGVAGLVIGTGAANICMAALQATYLRRELGGLLDGRRTVMITARIAVASVLLGGAARLVWDGLDAVLGGSLPAQLIAVGGAALAGVWIYGRAVLRMRVGEAHLVTRLLPQLVGRAAG